MLLSLRVNCMYEACCQSTRIAHVWGCLRGYLYVQSPPGVQVAVAYKTGSGMGCPATPTRSQHACATEVTQVMDAS